MEMFVAEVTGRHLEVIVWSEVTLRKDEGND